MSNYFASQETVQFPDSPTRIPRPPAVPGMRGAFERLRHPTIATETKRSYACTWRAFSAFCATRGLDPTDGDIEAICGFIGGLYTNGRSVAGMRVAIAGLRFRFNQTGRWTLEHSNRMRDFMQRVSRKLAPSGELMQRQTAPLTLHIYRKIEQWSLREVGKPETSEWQRRDILTDLALISVMRDGLLRRSEAAALDWEDINEEPEDEEEFIAPGCAVAYLRCSKTDQTGEGAYIYLSPRTVRHLNAMERPKTGPVFVSLRNQRVSPKTICRRIKRAVERVGIDPSGFSGHSTRVGMARDLATAGYNTTDLKRAGRWKREATVDRYIQSVSPHSNAVARFHRSLDTNERKSRRQWAKRKGTICERDESAL